MQEVFEKIIEKLESEYEDIKEIYKRTKDMSFYFTFQGVNKAIEIVKKESEKYNNGWIPCNSGVMPKECITKDEYTDPSEEVLVYIYYGENCVNNGCGVSRYWEHTKFHKNPWIDLKYGKENVVAWQPLPQPYNPNACQDKNCPYNDGNECPAADGCAGYERKRTNFDMCCESMEAMAQIIDIAKIGWTKDKIMEWLQSEVEE